MENSEQRQTEKALRESENRYHSLVAALAEGVVLQDANGEIVTCNQSAERILGLTLEQMKGRTSVDSRWRPVHEDGSPFPGDAHPAVVTLKTGVPQVGVIMGVHKPDGTLTWISINTQPIATTAAAGPYAVVSSFRDISGMKHAEEALRKSAEEIKDLYNRAPCGYHSLDDGGVIVRINDTELEWLGYARDEIVGKTHISDLLTPNSARMFQDNFAEFKARGWVHGLELEMVRRNGTILPVLLNATAVKDSDGRFVMSRSTLHDITEHKRSEAALQESEVRLQAFLDNSPSVIFAKDLDGRYLHVNAQFRRRFGLSKRQIAGSTDDDLFAPHQAAIFRANDREVIERGTALEFEETVDYVDGPRTNIVCKFPIPDAAGNIVAIGGIATDITERIEAEAARARLASIVESSQDAIFTRSPDGIIQSWNAGAECLYGYTAAEAIGQPISRLVPPDRKHERADNWRRLSQGQPVPPYETVRITKDGRRINVSVSLSPLRDRAGNVTGVAAIIHDITKRKRAEEEIRRLNQELELRVRQRTADLAEAVAELQAFSYSVSHDLRSPLRSIVGFGKILLKENYNQLDDEGKRLLERSIAAGQRMEQLIDDLLHLAQISHRQILAGKVNLSVVAKEAIDSLAEADPERCVDVVITPDMNVLADPGLMRVVMDNLIGNAWKFTAKLSRARIEVGATRSDGSTVYFVRDNGAGFDMARAEKLFNAFQRMHRASDFEGTGIGLATVRRIIRRHRGRIWVESAVDRGTTVFFTLGNQA